jgi:polar amino acid transport system ATP-binding protein
LSFLELLDVHKYFGDNEVLRGVSLGVDEHQVVCLIGPSGCGKSTLLRCINALEAIQQGEIRLEGQRVSGRGGGGQRVAPHLGLGVGLVNN